MNRFLRITQNKSKRQKKVKEAEFHELKAENQRLKRENSRLKKQLEKLHSSIGPIEEEESKSLAEADGSANCPKCNSSRLTKLELGVKILTVCRDCKWRRAS